jgi:hypothetical protein
MLSDLNFRVLDDIVRYLSPDTMAQGFMSCHMFASAVNRVVKDSTAHLSRFGEMDDVGGTVLSPSDGEGWAMVARYAEQLRLIPLGGGDDVDNMGDDEGPQGLVIPIPEDRGARRDHYSFQCTSDAKLVYASEALEMSYCEGYESYNGGLCRVNKATGVIEDRCYEAYEPDHSGRMPGKRSIWKPRRLPLRCALCSVEFTTLDDFCTHCALFSHRQLSVPKGKRVPVDYIDPRLLDDANTKPLARLYDDVTEWYARVVHRLTTLEKGNPAWKDMERYAADARSNVELPNYSDDLNEATVPVEEMTAEMAFKVCSEDFALSEFKEKGLWPGATNYAMVVLCDGWEGFHFFGSSSFKGFLYRMTGISF